MNALITRLWNDETGATYTVEVLLVATLLVLGTTVGLGRVRVALANEMNDLANAIGSINQSFYVPSIETDHCHASVAGSAFKDERDECDCDSIDLCGRVKDHNGTVGKGDIIGSRG